VSVVIYGAYWFNIRITVLLILILHIYCCLAFIIVNAKLAPTCPLVLSM
jgi:hypothetical protein